MMKKTILLSLIFVIASFGQQSAHKNPVYEEDGIKIEFLSYTYNWATAVFSWKLMINDKPEFFEIDTTNAIMRYNKEEREFSREEADKVHQLMDMLVSYAIESNIWWKQGKGKKLDTIAQVKFTQRKAQ